MIDQAAATVAAVAAGIAGAIYLTRKTVRFLRALDRLARLIEHELTNNAGSSMKDDLHSVAVNVGKLQGDFRDLGTRVETLEALEILGYRRPSPRGDRRKGKAQ